MARRERSIHGAIAEVLKASGRSMTPVEIYATIVARKLYEFHARAPLHVVKTQLRRHCKDFDFPSAHVVKYFGLDAEGRYRALEVPVRVPASLYTLTTPGTGKPTVVSVPEADQDAASEGAPDARVVTHSEVQWRLLDLGARMGLSVWAPMADRGRCSQDGRRLSEVPALLKTLPLQFDAATTKTIQNIDVLWLEKNAIVAGFEIEHTTSIYSGLLRMSDLLTMQPNIAIALYLVAPDERFAKFAREVARPTFARLRRPLHESCRFLPYTTLLARLADAGDLVRHLRPEFLKDLAEAYDPNAELTDAD